MKLATPKQMREIDSKAINEYLVPSILLMEHAAYGVCTFIKENFEGTNIVIICGPGNNGGDGFALARQLYSWGIANVHIIIAMEEEKLFGDGAIYYQTIKRLNIPVLNIITDKQEEAYKVIENSDVIVDALFGTGLTRNIEGVQEQIIKGINQAKGYTISIDIPSGIQGETGKVSGIAVKADKTFTFAIPKIGLYRYPGMMYCGEIEIVNIGIPPILIESFENKIMAIDSNYAKECLPKRYVRSNKGTYGKVLLIGGQTGMSGAIALAANAALKVGAGLVTAAIPETIFPIIAQKLTEVMTKPLADENGYLGIKACQTLQMIINNYDVLAIGPGIGRNEDTKEVLKLVLQTEKPCIIDADALYLLKDELDLLKQRKSTVIITPHPGEMAHLTGISIKDILENALEIAKEFAEKYQVITVLKLERTIIATPEGKIAINICGNNGLAKGGSGDILTGIITGLMAQHVAPDRAAHLGVYLHARAADVMLQEKTEYSLLPTDIYEGIEKVFKEIIDGK